MLGQGAFIERLRSNRDFELDPRIVNSAFLMAGGEGSFREHFVLQRILAFSSMKPLTHVPGQESKPCSGLSSLMSKLGCL
jgi:hypothetical protein